MQNLTSEQVRPKSLKVLMISLDPGLLSASHAGDTLARHEAYARQVETLDIIVLGGTEEQHISHGNLTVHGIGMKGVRGLWKARQFALACAREKKPNLIVTQDPHATGWIGMFCSRAYGIPLLVDVHGDFVDNHAWLRESWKNRIYAALQMRVFASARKIRVVSSGIAESLMRHGISPQIIATIHTPINVEIFERLDERQQVFLEELRFKYSGKKLLVFCGRLVPAKNLFFLLNVLSELRKQQEDWMLLVIGDGELRSQLERQVKRAHLQEYVQFLGTKEQSELAVYYRAGLCLVLPSTNESFGKVIIEAGVSGIPCLASSTTGASHIITDGVTGFLAPINDVQAFVDILGEMLEYPEQTQQLGEWARERYSLLYDPKRTIADIIALWKETASL